LLKVTLLEVSTEISPLHFVMVEKTKEKDHTGPSLKGLQIKDQCTALVLKKHLRIVAWKATISNYSQKEKSLCNPKITKAQS